MSLLVAKRELEPDLDLGIAPERLWPATEPAEIRGGGRDDVRLLLQDTVTGRFSHHHFRELAALLEPGDLVVVNRSATLPAALPARDEAARPLRLHVARRLGTGLYLAEARSADGLQPAAGVPAVGERLQIGRAGEPGLGLRVVAHPAPSSRQIVVRTRGARSLRPWQSALGESIRYAYVPRAWPLEFYQTIFAGPPGSAEMPSAARPFTARTLADLRRRGVRIAYLTLHCGLSSEEVGDRLDGHFLPPEPYHLPAATVRAIADAHARGGRVIAVGTTVVRALVSATAGGSLRPGRGEAGAVVRPGTDLPFIDALLTGMHAPRTSHLALLETFIAPDALAPAYESAIAQGYLWHEFGDVHLLLPGRGLG